ncbi:DUF3606 domain-containing protein [Massilia sp. CCM 8733]|uniref:DUF3606 domain-containing protein n=2 Tax=Massilia mucilaginosa TaxID=2609282 RepID=A0ABX0P2V7_9BURK|nr:DUF3606 domain-containing protein [Massilia mucilaginosa]
MQHRHARRAGRQQQRAGAAVDLGILALQQHGGRHVGHADVGRQPAQVFRALPRPYQLDGQAGQRRMNRGRAAGAAVHPERQQRKGSQQKHEEALHERSWRREVGNILLRVIEHRAKRAARFACVIERSLARRGGKLWNTGAHRAALEKTTMSDNPLEPNPQDYDRINVNVEAELVYWTDQFGVPRARLAEAIEQVGPRVVDLQKYLGISVVGTD